MTSYWELLKDPRWQRKRLEILQAANFACRDCGETTKTLHVHHSRYIKGRKPWEYDDSDLRCVCEDCHEAITALAEGIAHVVGCLRIEGLQSVLGFARATLWEDRYKDSDTAVGLSTIKELFGILSALGASYSNLWETMETLEVKYGGALPTLLSAEDLRLISDARRIPMAYATEVPEPALRLDEVGACG